MLKRIAPHLHLAETQHGSTTTALLPLVQQTAIGFNQRCHPRRTVIMAVDFSKTFDTVNHTALFCTLLGSVLDSNPIRLLCTYLRGRTVSCSYIGTETTSFLVKQWVQQSFVLSLVLFNFFITSYPQSTDHCTSYAVDFTVFA